MFFYRIINKSKVIIALASSSCLVPTLSLGAESSPLERERNLTGSQSFPFQEKISEYGGFLLRLIDQNLYDEAFCRASAWEINTEKLLPSDLEEYLFCRLFSLTKYHIGYGRISGVNLDLEAAKGHYQKALTHAATYISRSQSFAFENSLTRRGVILSAASEAAFAWACLIPDSSEAKDLKLKKSLLNRAIQYQEDYVNYANNDGSLKEEKALLDEKNKLFRYSLSIIPYCGSGQEKKPFLQKAKDIRNEFRKRSGHNPEAQKLFEGATRSLGFFQARSDFQKSKESSYENRPGSKNLKKIAAAKRQKERERYLHIIQEANEINDDGNFSPLDIVDKHSSLCAFGQDCKPSDVSATLKEIEATIRAQLAVSEEPTLQAIYERYAQIIGTDKLVNAMSWYGLASFLLSGDVEAALERVNIISDWKYEGKNGDFDLIPFLRAAIKSMNGDCQEWVDFEKGMITNREKISKNKKRKKQRQRDAYVEAAKQSQEEALSREKTKEMAAEKDKQTFRSQESAVSVEDMNRRPIDPSFIPLDLASQKEAKEEKAGRHAAAQRQREEAQQASSSHSSSSSSSTAAPGEPVKDKGTAEAISLPLIGAGFSLTGVAKDVEEEIQSGAWRFSRENAMAYFKALGCTAKEGGKHKKVELPQAVMIYHKGEIVAIINDLSGALTLPRWDGREGDGTAPHYLRKQILKAREKLLPFEGAKAVDEGPIVLG